MSPPPGRNIFAIAPPRGRGEIPKARGLPGGGCAQLELTDTLANSNNNYLSFYLVELSVVSEDGMSKG